VRRLAVAAVLLFAGLCARADAAGNYTTAANKYFLTDGDDASATGMWADFDRN